MKKIEERFQSIIELAPNAMILVNSSGVIMMTNKQTEIVFGYSDGELLNHKIDMLIPLLIPPDHTAILNNFFDSATTRMLGAEKDLFAIRKDRSEFPVEIGLNSVETPDGTMVLVAVIDKTKRKKEEEYFRLVVEAAPNAIILVNQEGKITLVNTETERLFEYSRNELIGQGVELLIPERFQHHHPKFREGFFNTPKTRTIGVGRELFGRRKDKSEFPVEIGLNPIELPEGTAVLASIIDISERKAQESNRLKSEFLASMSHELRTPMNAILGFSELLIDQKVGSLNEKQLDYLNDIHASGSHLLQLINNVLDLAKIESGKVTLSVESFDVSESIQNVLRILKPVAGKKGVFLKMDLSGDIQKVRLDKNKFRQILYNLLSNAIKFNKNNGEVVIETGVVDATTFFLRVKDTGIGISPENMKKLFVPFVQIDTGTARQHEGSGLGLVLTKNIVELHGGKISIESKQGEGSAFILHLPFEAEDHARHS